MGCRDCFGECLSFWPAPASSTSLSPLHAVEPQCKKFLLSVSIQLHWCRRNDDDHQNYAKALTLIRMCLHAKRHKRSSMYVAHSLYLFGILVSRHGLVLFGLPCHSTSLHTTQYSLRICLIIIKYNSVRAATMWVHSGERTLSDSGAIFYCTPRYEHVLLLMLLVCRPR